MRGGLERRGGVALTSGGSKMHLVVHVYCFIVCMIPIRGLAAAQHPHHSPGLVTDFRQHPVVADTGHHKYQHSSTPAIRSQIAYPKLCDDPRCQCLSTSVGYNVTCHCAPQDKVTHRVVNVSVMRSTASLTSLWLLLPGANSVSSIFFD